jgi:hypothetical protein
MFIQVPQVVNDGDVTIAVYQLIAGLRFAVPSAPRMKVIFEGSDVVD